MSKCGGKMAGEWLKAECPYSCSLYIYAILIRRASKPTKIFDITIYNIQQLITQTTTKEVRIYTEMHKILFFPVLFFFSSHTKKGCRSKSTFTLAKVYKCTIIQSEVCIHYWVDYRYRLDIKNQKKLQSFIYIFIYICKVLHQVCTKYL